MAGPKRIFAALEPTTHPVGPIFVAAQVPSFFPRINEQPRTPDYRVTLADTTRPVVGLAFRTAITPSTYFFPRINERPIAPDVIGRALAATTSPVQPQAPPVTVVSTPSNWIQNPDATLPDQKWGAS